jgi:hypothetical protein
MRCWRGNMALERGERLGKLRDVTLFPCEVEVYPGGSGIPAAFDLFVGGLLRSSTQRGGGGGGAAILKHLYLFVRRQWSRRRRGWSRLEIPSVHVLYCTVSWRKERLGKTRTTNCFSTATYFKASAYDFSSLYSQSMDSYLPRNAGFLW